MKIIYLGTPTQEEERKQTRGEQYKEFFEELGLMLAVGVVGAFTLLGIVTYFGL